MCVGRVGCVRCVGGVPVCVSAFRDGCLPYCGLASDKSARCPSNTNAQSAKIKNFPMIGLVRNLKTLKVESEPAEGKANGIYSCSV